MNNPGITYDEIIDVEAKSWKRVCDNQRFKILKS